MPVADLLGTGKPFFFLVQYRKYNLFLVISFIKEKVVSDFSPWQKVTILIKDFFEFKNY